MGGNLSSPYRRLKLYKVSVIIGSYRPGKCLYRCIKSLNKQTILPDEVIIGVDRFDTYRVLTAEKCKFPLSVAVSGKTGVSAARNAAYLTSTGDILAFIDDDAVADTDWVAQIQRIFNNQSVSCAGGPVFPQFERQSIPQQWYWIIGCTGISNRPICSNMAIRRSDFKEMGGFPENLGRIKQNLNIGEETELILALEANGKRVVWEPPMITHHWCPASRLKWNYIISRAYKEGVGKAIISKRYPMNTEKAFLKHYLTNPDRYTIPVLAATGLGFLIGGYNA